MAQRAGEEALEQASLFIDEVFKGEKRSGRFGQGDAAQVTGDDSQAEPALHAVEAVIGTFAPAEVAPQAGNASLDARTPAIATLPAACPFQGLALLRQLA